MRCNSCGAEFKQRKAGGRECRACRYKKEAKAPKEAKVINLDASRRRKRYKEIDAEMGPRLSAAEDTSTAWGRVLEKLYSTKHPLWLVAASCNVSEAYVAFVLAESGITERGVKDYDDSGED